MLISHKQQQQAARQNAESPFYKYSKAYSNLIKYDAVMIWGVDTTNHDEFIIINPSDKLFPVTFLNGFSE